MKWYLGAALILLAALILESGLMAYAMYVLLGLLVLSRIMARTWTKHLSATRTCKVQSAEVGDEISVEVTVRNAGWIPVPWVLLEDHLPRKAIAQKFPRLGVSGKRIHIRALPGGQEFKIKYKVQCLMRGYYQIGPLVMESGDLFGLHRRYRVDADPHFILVYPKVVPMQGYDIASRRPVGDIRIQHRLYEDPTRIAGVRPFEIGDPLNRVHWRATARTGVLHSKVYEPSTLAGSTVVLDLHQDGYHRQGEPFRSELAITTAVSLVNAVCELGQQVGLICNARDATDRIRLEGWEGEYHSRIATRRQIAQEEDSDRLQPLIVPTRRGVEQLQRVREIMARVELTDGLTFPQLIAETASRLPRDATVLAILPEVSIETAITLGNLRRQGYAVSVILILFDEGKLEKAHARLLAERILDVRHLPDEATLPMLCSQQVQRVSPYLLTVD